MKSFEIGQAIREFRRRYGITQGDLAAGICDQGLISRIEKGNVIPSSYLLVQFADRMGISVEDIINHSKFDNVEYVNEVIHQVDLMLKEKNYIELNDFCKLEQNNPLFNDDQGNRYFLWLEATCLYYIEGDAKGSIQMLTHALQSKETSKKSNSKLDFSIKNSLCVIYGETEQYDLAYNGYKSLIEDLRINVNVDFKSKIKIHYNFTKILLHLELYNECLTYCDAAVKMIRAQDSMFLLGNFYYQSGYTQWKLSHIEEAIQAIDKAEVIFTIEGKQNVIETITKRKKEILSANK